MQNPLFVIRNAVVEWETFELGLSVTNYNLPLKLVVVLPNASERPFGFLIKISE